MYAKKKKQKKVFQNILLVWSQVMDEKLSPWGWVVVEVSVAGHDNNITEQIAGQMANARKVSNGVG